MFGFYGFNDGKLARKMQDAIAHRGPNGTNRIEDQRITLGYRHLNAVDGPRLNQPFMNEDESIWMVCDAWISNRDQISEEIEKSHRYTTDSGLETIVHLYEDYGTTFPERLKGEFAVAIWDRKKRQLILARDRMGVRPIYYAIRPEGIIFASEMKAVLRCDLVARRIDYRALDKFMTLRFIPGPETMITGLLKLMPAHILTFAEKRCKIERYWTPKHSNQDGVDENFYVKRFRQYFQNAVFERVPRDEPISVLLSGGIDSSSIAAIGSRAFPSRVKTFSVGFGEKVDELEYARKVAETLSTDHHETIIGEESVKTLPKILWHQDEPLADPASIPTFLGVREARRYSQFVFTGEGADEVVGGYEYYELMRIGEEVARVPQIARRAAPQLLMILPDSVLDSVFMYASSLGKQGRSRSFQFFENLESKEKALLAIISIFDEEEREELYTDRLKRKLGGKLDNAEKALEPYFNETAQGDLLEKMMRLDLEAEVPAYCFLKVDKMWMANSTAPRIPFADDDLLEFCQSLPSAMKLRGTTGKYVLRKAMEGMLPNEIIRRKKHRFFVPIDVWLERSRLAGEMLSQLVSEEVVIGRGLIDREYVRKIFEGYSKSKLYYSRQLWNLATLELWIRIFVDREDVGAPPNESIIFAS